MGKIKYYCDFCDRSFLDDFSVRQKHLTGTLHIRQRKQYYNQFRDAKTILEDERKAEACKKFMYNNCPFGENCKYSHSTPAYLESLRQQVLSEEAAKRYAMSVEAALEKIPSVDKINSWLTSRLDSSSDVKSGKSIFSDLITNVQLSPVLQGFSQLPPSLQPWDANVYDNVEFSEWG